MAAPWEKYQATNANTDQAPWLKYQASPSTSDPKMSAGKASAVQGEAGALLGLRPVVAGAGAAAGAFTGTNGTFGSKLAAAKDAFTQGRADANDEQNLARQQYPIIGAAASIGGSLLTAPLLPATVGLRGAIGLGAGMGVAQAAGSAQNASDAATDIAGGVGLGAAGYGAAKTIGGALSSFAESKAYKAAGAMLKDFRAAFNRDPEKINELGRTMLDNGLVKMGDDVGSIAKKSELLKRQTGQQIGEVYNKVLDTMTDPKVNMPPEVRMAVEASGFHPEAQAEEMKTIVSQEFKGKPGSTGAIHKANQVIDEMAVNGNHLTPDHALELKGSIDSMINWSKKSQDLPMDQEALKTVRGYIQDKLNNQVKTIDSVLQSPQSKELKRLNSLYGNVATIANVSRDRALRESANKSFGLTDSVMAGGGLGAGALVGLGMGHEGMGAAIGGIAAAAANKMGRTYGNAAMASGANSLAGNSNPFIVGGSSFLNNSTTPIQNSNSPIMNFQSNAPNTQSRGPSSIIKTRAQLGN